MARTMTLSLTDEEEARLEKIMTDAQMTRHAVVKRILQSWLGGYEAALDAGIQIGLSHFHFPDCELGKAEVAEAKKKQLELAEKAVGMTMIDIIDGGKKKVDIIDDGKKEVKIV